jgi:DNA-directed RNA polymerase specialized sigma subunit
MSNRRPIATTAIGEYMEDLISNGTMGLINAIESFSG